MAPLRFVSSVLASLSAVFALAAHVYQTERYANVPTQLEMMDVWEELKAKGFFREIPLIKGARPHSRFERAVQIHSRYKQIKIHVNAVSVFPLPDLVSASLYAYNLHKLEFLFWAHTGELIMMGVDLNSVKKGFGETAQKLNQLGFPVQRTLGIRFRDVPPGHWASSAVHGLRDIGVLKGYPNARFRP